MLNQNNMRELAYIAKVLSIERIVGYDKVHLIKVLGWQCVAPISIQKDDLVVYFEVDSVLPQNDNRFSFLASKKFRIKPIKICGLVSHGLVLPLSDFPELKNCKEGEFVTDKLGVTLYEDNYENVSANKQSVSAFDKAKSRHKKFFSNPVVKFMMRFKLVRSLLSKIFVHKKDKISWPVWLPKTNSERVQNMPTLFTDHETKWIATEKVDGMSTSFILDEKDTYMVASHNVIVYSSKVKNSEKVADGSKYVNSNVWVEMSDKYSIMEKLTALKKKYKLNTVAIQGETYGDRIQKRSYSCKGNEPHKLAVFHIWFNGERLAVKRMIEICDELNLPHVNVFDWNLSFPNTAEELIEKVDSCKSAIDGGMIEGFVIYSQDGQLNYKCVSPSFLLKYH
jgi:hypothetical protein